MNFHDFILGFLVKDSLLVGCRRVRSYGPARVVRNSEHPTNTFSVLLANVPPLLSDGHFFFRLETWLRRVLVNFCEPFEIVLNQS